MQLVCYGAQDAYLTENPRFAFFPARHGREKRRREVSNNLQDTSEPGIAFVSDDMSTIQLQRLPSLMGRGGEAVQGMETYQATSATPLVKYQTGIASKLNI